MPRARKADAAGIAPATAHPVDTHGLTRAHAAQPRRWPTGFTGGVLFQGTPARPVKAQATLTGQPRVHAAGAA